MTPRWTREQMAAIETTGADVLVSASAGTGKTAVLVERLVRRILAGPDPVDLDRLLVVTFTDAAAAEMRERVLRTLLKRSAEAPADPKVQRQLALLPRAQISTLHSFCLSLVREHFHELGLDPELRVMDEHEAELLRLEMLDRLFEGRYESGDAEFLDLVDRYAGDRGDEPLRRIVLDLHSYARGLPDLALWLKSAVEGLAPGPGGRLDQTGWGKELLEAVRAASEYITGLLDDALRRASQPGGPAEYAGVLLGEREAFFEMERAARAGSWSDLVAAADRPSKVRLPGSRGSDTATRAAAKASRDEAWKQFRRLQSVIRPEGDLLAELRQVQGPAAALAGLVLELEETARERRAVRGLLDFGDLEFYALRLLESPGGELVRKLRGRFAEVLVDEYQDINAVQYRLLDLVSRGNLFCIGDVKQSIYRFRGTDPGFFRRRSEQSTEVDPERGAQRIAPAAEGEGSAGGTPTGSPRAGSPRAGSPVRWRVALTRNFRSRPAVLDAANFMFGELMRVELAETGYGPRERLVPGFDYNNAPDPDGPVEVYVLERAGSRGAGEQAEDSPDGSPGQGEDNGPGTAEDDAAADEIEREAELVARRILRMVRGGRAGGAEFSVYDTGRGRYRPAGFRDVAVLLRAVRGRANRYLEVFGRLGVPVRADLSTGYFSAIEVETMLALLRVIDNPRQDIPLAAVLRSPVLGLDERELARIRAGAPSLPYYDAVLRAASAPGSLAERLRAFLDRLTSWRTAARRGPLSDLVWALLQETDYLGFAAGLPGGAQRQANLLALHDRAREFDRFARQGLARFLRFIEQLHENESDLGALSDPGEGADSVLLTSIHKSKGLEFPVVFLPDLGRQFHPRSVRDILWHSELGLGPVLADRAGGFKYPTAAWHAIDARISREELAEEMRLLYVGMTRARERLVLSGSVRNPAARTQAWAATAGAGAFIPETALRTDRTYLDWVCRALARHRCGGALRGADAGDPAASGQPRLSDDPSKWHVSLIPEGTPLDIRLFPAAETGGIEAEAEGAGAGEDSAGDTVRLTPDQWARVQALEPLTGFRPERFSEFERVSGWVYPSPGRTRVPAKVSVSRLSRRQAALSAAIEDGDAVVAAGQAAAPRAGFQGPELRPWGAGKSRPGPAELGILTHEVLSSLKPRGPFDAGSLRAQGSELERAGILAPGESGLVGWEDLEWFFASPLGRRLTEHPELVRREVPFSLAVPAVEAHPGEPDLEGEWVLVQGIIDCLVDCPGGPVILDYKTDRLAGCAEVDARTRAYAPQISLYARAVRESLGVPVKEAWIVYLRAREFRRIEVP